jgi:transcriptional regulator with XRE-family HTH domain
MSRADHDNTIHRFGEKLRALRIRHGMTLKQLARALGRDAHGYISELETGKKVPTVEIVIRAARLFNVTTDQLLKDELELDEDKTCH